jgi:hypothetical protein
MFFFFTFATFALFYNTNGTYQLIIDKKRNVTAYLQLLHLGIVDIH